MTRELTGNAFGPFFATPCGILAPLLTELESRGDLVTVSREDNAVGLAAGSALAGRMPVALMQNSGLGQSVNALASLIVPYQMPILLVISLRGTGLDTTAENLPMGRATLPILDALGIAHETFAAEHAAEQLARARDTLTHLRRPAALLIRPDAFGWEA
ncbi:thiamine pyrophosphate-binding protein [Streptomyces sp. NBC_00536]|nr:thiamine pyrophosphate-binding protein [Streptomyces sp. NBC_00536]